MSQFVEDLLCGLVGYGVGRHSRNISEAQAEDLITSYLRDIPLNSTVLQSFQPFFIQLISMELQPNRCAAFLETWLQT